MSFSPSNLLAYFSATSQEMSDHQKGSHSLLNLPWLICFVAKASTINSSTMILTSTSVIAGVGRISV